MKKDAINFALWIVEKMHKEPWFRYDQTMKNWYVHGIGHLTTDMIYEMFKADYINK